MARAGPGQHQKLQASVTDRAARRCRICGFPDGRVAALAIEAGSSIR